MVGPMKPQPAHPTNPTWLSIRFTHVLCHDYVGRFITILPHVIASQIERSPCKYVLRQRHVTEYIFALGRPGKYPALAQVLVLAVVYLQAIEIVIASKEFSVHHAPEIKIHTPIGIGGDVTTVVSQ